MGFGDEIMVAALAAEMRAKDPRPVLVMCRKGFPRYHDIWIGNPDIVDPRNCPPFMQFLKNGPGFRLYIAGKTPERWHYTSWRVPRPGKIYLTAEEFRIGVDAIGDADPRPAILIEPHIKRNASPNKQWGFDRWQRVVAELEDRYRFFQCDYGSPILAGVTPVKTRTFREACGLLSNADLFVGPEGGLHHAAAALGIRAVVYFGGMTSPKNTGYETHVNVVYDAIGSPCGSRLPCAHCQQGAALIDVDYMSDKINEAIDA